MDDDEGHEQHPQLPPRATACGVETGSNGDREGQDTRMTTVTTTTTTMDDNDSDNDNDKNDGHQHPPDGNQMTMKTKMTMVG
jgi:hypothetical protein